MKFKALKTSLAAISIVLAGVPVTAQVITGVIVGTVRDESGAVLPGATVTITSEQLPGGPRVAVTAERGQYRFPNLPPGAYGLTVELQGFGTYNEEGLQVSVGGNTERVVTLSLSSFAETVTVTGESPIVDTRKSGVSTNYDAEFMQNTPLRRFSMFDFTKSAPGMSGTNPTSGTSTRVSSFGSSTDENTYLMDGTDFTAPVSGAAWPWPDTDTIEEIEIIQLGASAEYNVAGGAVFNAVTRQGTNELRGDAAYFGMWDTLTAKPILEPCDCPEGGTGFTRDRFNDFTVHAGFPIVKDKAWLYAGYQYQRDYDSQPGTDPAFPRKFEADRLNYKFTWQVTEDVKFMSTYHDDYWVIPDIPSLSTPFDVVGTSSGHNPSLTFADVTHVLSPSTFYDVRVSGFYSPNDQYVPNGNVGESHRLDVATGVESGSLGLEGKFRQSRTAVHGKLSHYASDFLGTDHDFKFGVQYVDGAHSQHYGYTNNARYYDYYGEPYYAYFRDRYNYGGKFENLGAFAEDLVHLGRRATLTLGVRFDRWEAISQDVDQLDSSFETVGTVPGLGTLYTNNNVAPRLGVNVKLDEAGKTVLRGSFGLFYRGVITGEIDIVHPGLTPITSAFFDPATGEYTDVSSITDPNENVRVSSDVTSPVTRQFSVGLDHEIGNDLALGVTYVRKDQDDLNGWLLENAEFGRASVTLDNGQSLEVFPILTDPSDRVFVMGNQPRFFSDVDNVMLQLRKRWSRGWQAQVSYNWQDARGLIGSNAERPHTSQETRLRFGSRGTIGLDPNDFTNATGNLLNDRTHTLIAQGAVEIPRADVLVGVNYRYFTGKPWAAYARIPAAVVDPVDFDFAQGSRRVYIEPLGSRRLSSQSILDLRISKVFRFGERGKFEVLTDILNVLNDTGEERLVTRNFFSSSFGDPNRWIDPRRAFVGVKLAF